MRRVFVLGNATLDCIQRVRRLPNPGETLLCDSLRRCAGGKGLNQALASVRTGTPTVLAAAIGRDAEAAVVNAAVDGEPGLETRWIVSQAQTDYSSIWVTPDGENAIVSSAAAAQGLSEIAAMAALADFAPGDLLVMQGNLARGVTEAAAALARERGGFCVLNTAPIAWDMSRVVGMVDLVVANRVEAAELASGDPATAAERLASGGNCMAVVTLGAEGAILASREGISRVAAPAVEAVDSSGAGDVLVGTLAGCLARGLRPSQALEAAVAAASIAVTREGTVPSFPSGEEIERLIGR